MVSMRTSTIQDIKNFNTTGSNNSFILDKTNITQTTGDKTFPFGNILKDKYRGIIFQNCIEIEFTGDELVTRYMYKPRLFSDDLYGTMELWYLVLWLNDLSSVTQFNKSKYIVLHPKNFSVLEEIIKKENL